MKTVHNCDLTQFNSYRISSRCRIAYFPESANDVADIFAQHPSGAPPVIIGSGHNIILARAYYETPFIIFHGNLNQIQISGETMTIGAGAFTQAVCEKALAHALSGFEMFYDIPSSIGGAVVMNAGAKDEDIAGILETVTYLDLPVPHLSPASPSPFYPLHGDPLSGRRIPSSPPETPASPPKSPTAASRIPHPLPISAFQDFSCQHFSSPAPLTIPNHAANFRYRNSIFPEDPTKIVLSATFKLRKEDPERIRAKMYEIKAERWAKQPREYPNAGSVFKRPTGRYVGPMLDELGLKGHTHGGFRVSPKHSGFIEKIGPGTGSDLLALIADIQNRVRDRFDVELEVEQRIITAS